MSFQTITLGLQQWKQKPKRLITESVADTRQASIAQLRLAIRP
jgi:hypothetical protein